MPATVALEENRRRVAARHLATNGSKVWPATAAGVRCPDRRDTKSCDAGKRPSDPWTLQAAALHELWNKSPRGVAAPWAVARRAAHPPPAPSSMQRTDADGRGGHDGADAEKWER